MAAAVRKKDEELRINLKCIIGVPMTDSSLIRKGDNTTCLSRVAYGHAGLLFYRRCGVARGRKPHCRTRADEVRTDGGMTATVNECMAA